MGARTIIVLLSVLAVAVGGCMTNEWERQDFEEPSYESNETPEGEIVPGVPMSDDEGATPDGGLLGDEIDGGLSGDLDGGAYDLDAGSVGDGALDDGSVLDGGAASHDLLDGGTSDEDERETLSRGGDATPPDRQDGNQR